MASVYYFDPDTKNQRTKSSMGNAYNKSTNLYRFFSIWTKPTCYQAIDILKFDNILNLVI